MSADKKGEDDDVLPYGEEEVDYEEGDEETEAKESKKGSYAGIHASSFKDMLLRAELLRAISDVGFELPSQGLR